MQFTDLIKNKNFWIGFTLLALVGGYGCASKSPENNATVGGGSETEIGGGKVERGTGGAGQGPAGTINGLPTPSKCETDPNLKSNPLCQIVLTGFSGELTTPNNPTKVQGYLKNDYFLDGKLKSTTWYANKSSTQPVMVSSYVYNTDGTIQSVDTTLDTNTNGEMDQKFLLTNSYQNGKPATTDLTLTILPANTLWKKSSTVYSYPSTPNPLPSGWPLDTTLVGKLTTEIDYSKSPTTPNATSYEYNFLNSDNLPVESRILRSENPWNGQGIFQKFESVETFQYTDKKLAGSQKKLYDCTKSATHTCIADFILGVLPSLAPYGQLDTTWTYTTDGKLSHGETTVQGDVLNPNGPNAGNLTQSNPYKWQCDLSYDNANQKVVAKFPDILKFIGLSETDKIQSLTCDDFGHNLMGGSFTFDEWSYLWQATNQSEPQ